jgi:hypothetical protein
MTSNAYTILGWVAWQIGSRVIKRKMSENRVKLGAAGVVAAVLVVVAARAASDSDDD